jgi:hypothetical protein
VTFGLYEVVGRREYRGHKTGEQFEARIERGAERRAIQRGDIVFIREVKPELQPGSYALPDGWLSSHPHPINEAAKAASLIEGGK